MQLQAPCGGLWYILESTHKTIAFKQPGLKNTKLAYENAEPMKMSCFPYTSFVFLFQP